MFHCHIYQDAEKQAVANYYCLSYEKLAHMEFDRWRRLARRYSRALGLACDKCMAEGTPEEQRAPLNKTRFYRVKTLLRG